MTKIVVSEKALREMMREAMFNKEFSGWSANSDGPSTVDPVVDPSQAVTDPVNPNFTPQTKTEFGIAVNQLVKNLPDTEMPALFDTVKTAIDQKEEKEEENKMEKKTAAGGTGTVEEAVRKAIRKILAQNASLTEAGELPPVKKIPAGQHGGEYLRRGEKHLSDLRKWLKKTDLEPKPEYVPTAATVDEPDEDLAAKRNYKSTAIGGMSDVGGASFEDIAKELGFSIAGAKQLVDKTIEKSRWIMNELDEDEAEILILQAVNDYIKYLTKSGELTPADVQLMKDHPSIVRDLDGFREFLHTAIQRQRKEDQRLENPLGGETSNSDIDDDDDEEVEQVPASAPQSTPAPSVQPTAEKQPVLRKSKDSYKVYPWKGKRNVIRIGKNLYGTEPGGKLKDGGETAFKGGDRANVAVDNGRLKVSNPDTDHTQTWDPVEESKRPVLRLGKK